MIPQNVSIKIAIALFSPFLIVFMSCNPEKILTDYQLSITSPDGNSHWMGGETHAICWKSNLEENLKIELLSDGNVYKLITDKTMNSGNYNWTIPDNIPYNNVYRIKISDTGITGKSWTSHEFKLSEKPGSTALIQYNQINYKMVKIGFNWWMAENLRSKQLSDGSAIPLIVENSLWTSALTPAYSEYSNQNDNQIYGLLYNWYAVNTGKLCPPGWHTPSGEDWKYLAEFLGGQSVAGGKLKETGTGHWTNPNTGATNDSGFTGLPGGYRLSSVSLIGSYGCWWASTEYDIENAIVWSLNYNNTWLNNNPNQKKSGASVRCVRD